MPTVVERLAPEIEEERESQSQEYGERDHFAQVEVAEADQQPTPVGKRNRERRLGGYGCIKPPQGIEGDSREADSTSQTPDGVDDDLEGAEDRLLIDCGSRRRIDRHCEFLLSVQ